MEIKAISSGSKGNAYYISDEATSLLIECGVSFRKIRTSKYYNFENISGVLISHRHSDHCKSIKECANAGVEIYAPADVFKNNEMSGERCNAIKRFKAFNVGSFYILPFDLYHDCVNYGFLICSKKTGERLLYFTDTYMIKYKFEGLTHIMAECNYSNETLKNNSEMGVVPPWLKDRIKVSHMSLENLFKFMKENDLSKVKHIYLIHISETNGNAKVFRHRIKKATEKQVTAMN